MCIFKTPKVQAVKAPEPSPVPTEQDVAVTNARDAERRRRAMTGQRSTMLTSGVLSQPTSIKKTLLGQ